MVKRKYRYARATRVDKPGGPTPEQLAKHEYERVQPDKGDCDSALRDARGALRRVDGSMLDLLHHQGHLTARQWAAGRKLWEDWYCSGLEQHVTAAYDPDAATGRGGTREIAWTEKQVAARQRYTAALRAVGKWHTAVLIAVACDGVSPSAWAEVELGRGKAAAKPVGLDRLGVSLDMLADHYGLEDEAP